MSNGVRGRDGSIDGMSESSMRSTSIEDYVEARGYLMKRGHLLPTWNRRFFELTSKKLVYYVDETKEVLKGEFELASEMLVRDCNFRPFCFCLFQPGNNRRNDIFYLSTSTMEQKQFWMSMFSSVISRHRASKIRHDEMVGVSGKVEKSDKIAADTMKGIVTVRVVQAKKLTDLENETSPYVLITVGSSLARSQSATSTSNPVWDETFQFTIDGTNRFIKLGVVNDDSRHTGITIASVGISLMGVGLAGKRVPTWYKLIYSGEGTKKGFDGEIELEISIATERQGDKMYEPFMCLLDEVKKLPSLQCTYTSSGIGRDEDWDQDDDEDECRRSSSEDSTTEFSIPNPFSIFMPQSPQRPRTRSGRTSSSVGSDVDNPSQYFPMLHLEVPQDMCSTVALTSTGEDESFFCVGLLILSNFRLIFVENSKVVEPPHIWDTEPAVLTSGIALGDILECSMTARYDDNIKSVVDMLRIKTIDGRQCSFAFIETVHDLEDESSSDTGTNGWQPPDGVAGGVVKKRGEGVSGHETVLFGFARGAFSDQGVQQAYANIFKNVLYDYSYIDGIGSFEGPASQRIFQHVSLRTNNRYLMIYDMKEINKQTISSIVSTPGEIKRKETSVNYVKDGLETYIENTDLHKQLQIKFVKGWAIYRPESELERMGGGLKWRICDINKGYTRIPTYPECFIVPKAAKDETILGSIEFRSKGRLPALSWINPSNKCCITRCSQPLVGLSHKRNTHDEELLELINDTTGGSSVLVISDARPKINAQANQAAGKGYELQEIYLNTKITFLGLANIHVIRKSFDAAINLCSRQIKGSNNFLKEIDSTGWLENVRKILDAAVYVAHWNMVDGRNVLIHGSDGSDRTSQLTSLAMLMLDPYYRTIKGFSVLVEKEWCSFGHKFKDRCGWSHLGWHDEDSSPIFEIFLHCVYQIFQEQPTKFEFNETFLLFLAENLYNGYFGNFVVNNDRDRRQMLDKSFSIWFFIGENLVKFKSEIYIPTENDSSSSLSNGDKLDISATHVIPMVSSKNIILWKNRFIGWTNRVAQFFWTSPSRDDIFNEEEENEDSSWLQIDQSELLQCPKCKMKYSMFRRKEACRICNMVFCDKCLGPGKVCGSCRVLESPLSKVEVKRGSSSLR